MGLAGSFGWNDVTLTTKAYIDNATLVIGGNLTVDARRPRESFLWAISAGLAGSFNDPPGSTSFNIAGSFAYSDLDVTTIADINAAMITLGGAASVTADDESDINSIAGALALGGAVGFGAAVSYNEISGTTSAKIQDNSTIVQNSPSTTGDLTDGSTTVANLASTAGLQLGQFVFGEGIAEGTAITAIDTSNNSITLSKAAEQTATGTTLTFDQGLNVGSTAGSLSSGSTQVTLSFAPDALSVGQVVTGDGIPEGTTITGVDSDVSGGTTIVLSNAATADGSTTLTFRQAPTAHLLVGAGSHLNIVSIGASVGATSDAASIAIAATIGLNFIDRTTEASMAGSNYLGAAAGSAQNVQVSASDASSIVSLAGAIAAGKAGLVDNSVGDGGAVSFGFGFGAAIAYNDIDNDVKASINNSMIDQVGEVKATSTFDTYITSVAIGVGVSDISLAGSFTINKIIGDIGASIEGSSIDANAGVTVSGNDTSQIVSIAGSAALTNFLKAGAPSVAGVGYAVALNLVANRVSAFIDDSTVDADSVSVAAESNVLLVGVAVGATGGGAALTLSGSLTLNWSLQLVDAHISDSNVTADDDILVHADDTASLWSVSGSIAFRSGIAVGSSVAYNYVGGGLGDVDAVVRAGLDPLLDGSTWDDFFAASEADTVAYISSSTVTSNAGDVKVLAGFEKPDAAPDLTSIDLSEAGTIELPEELTGDNSSQIITVAVSGKAGSGWLSIGAAVTTNFIDRDVSAYIDTGSVIQASGVVAVQSTQNADIYSFAAAGSYSSASGGAAFTVNDIQNSVRAYVDNATINGPSQTDLPDSVLVSATTSSIILGISIAGSGGEAFQAGGSFTLNWIRTETDALTMRR